jgi:cobalamin biosynthesis protein CobW
MSGVPILLVAGYLGAGKTTLINQLLANASQRRIAAIVNDFGDIDIDAMLLSTVTDNLVSLKNGCICCSLQGDLLATLSHVLKRDPAPDAIVIETSGIADPAPIATALLDPVIFRAAALDTIVTLADAASLSDDSSRADESRLTDDPLWRAQIRAADFILLTKTDLVGEAQRKSACDIIRAHKPAATIFAAPHGAVDTAILFSPDIPKAARRRPATLPMSAPPFETVSWSSRAPLSLSRFQRVIGPIAAQTLRAKGLLTFTEHPDRPMLFQCVGQRATLAPAPTSLPEGVSALVVLIGRHDGPDLHVAIELLDATALRDV